MAAVENADRRLDSQYDVENIPLGEGTYGAVYMARRKRDGQTVAIKKMKLDHEEEGIPSSAIREVALLKGTEHPSIVKLLDVFCSLGKLHLVFQFVDLDLKRFMQQQPATNNALDCATSQSFLRQLLCGLDFCHSRRIIHRDLKPQNLLIERATRTLRIADFGMARAFSIPIPKYTHEVITTWYRAPEILLGTEEYSVPVDIWSTGCILGEMVSGSALFRGDSEIDTIFQIFQKRGTPTDQEWPGLSELPDFKPTFPKWPRRQWSDIRNIANLIGPDGVALLDELLSYNPRARCSARRALEHRWFRADGDAAMDMDVTA
jgi:cyclin-dependent kinase 2